MVAVFEHDTRKQVEKADVSVRDLDWRFLLPLPAGGQFQHLVLIGGTAELAELALDVGVAHRVSRHVPCERSADALVLYHDATVPLDEAVRCLRTGGVLYCEVERGHSASVTTTPVHVRRTLRAAGMTPTGVYWVRPDVDNRQMYLPIDAPHVLRWYLDVLFIAATPVQQALEPCLHFLSRFGDRALFPLARCFAVTAVADAAPRRPPAMLDDPVVPIQLQQPDVRPLLLTAGQDDFQRVILLPFTRNASRPECVLKCSRVPERNEYTRNEQEVLGSVRSYLDAQLSRTIPDPLGTLEWNGLAVGIESCVPGRLFSTVTGRWRTPLHAKLDQVRLATDWLIRFHRQTQVRQMYWNEDEIRQWIEIPLTRYERAFGSTSEEERLFAAVRAQARRLIGQELPIVWEHYAFDDQNIYKHGREIYVVDWEGAGAGLPLFDLLYFVTRWNRRRYCNWEETTRLQSFAELFHGSEHTRVSAAVQRAITTYMKRLNIDREFYPLLLVMMWVSRALYRHDRHEALGAHDTSARAGNPYVEYTGVLAKRVESLFRTSMGL